MKYIRLFLRFIAFSLMPLVFSVSAWGQTLSDYVASLTFGGHTAVVCRMSPSAKSETVFVSLPRKTFEADAAFTVGCAGLPSDVQVSIDGAPLADGGSLVLNHAGSHSLSVLREGKEVAKAAVIVTCLPLVELHVSLPDLDVVGYDLSNIKYVAGKVRVVDPEAIAGADTLMNCRAKYRGGTALYKPKRPYSLKLTESDGEKMNCSLLGLRSDNHWILDAAYIDNSRLRNRVATDLWLDYSAKPYHQRYEPQPVRSGTRGKYVEVFTEGVYYGLYCLMEAMDRKQLRLEKYDVDAKTGRTTVRGSLYKPNYGSYETYFAHEDGETGWNYADKHNPAPYNNSLHQEDWQAFLMRYPDYEDEDIDWGPLWRAVRMVAMTSEKEYLDSLPIYFDLPVFLDYYLLLDLTAATDNHFRNIYYFTYDARPSAKKRSKGFTDSLKLGLAVWDLDCTFGNYDYSATADYETLLADPYGPWEHHSGIYHRMQISKSFGWRERLEQRYAELRPQWFNPDNLAQRFADYAELFALCGADRRENARWGIDSEGKQRGYSVADDAKRLQQWVRRRIAHLDKQYGYDPSSATGLSDAVGPRRADADACYDLQGRRLAAPPARGFYIRNGRKLLK